MLREDFERKGGVDMAQFVLDLSPEMRERIEVRSGAANQKPESFMLMAIRLPLPR